ncbi:hypothetical protein C9374_001039 [Naegleria lovaniensis]|uniref:Uncharacterized protein n=1 Tax=Naegleria lovaniensis TaxID=51637 RepID=A0AA88GYU4_NAELO|nr:uncharacterized protein C9374_001039 [Naegleria lovaniensis]KAG2388189.1 hypothetical protein C9374_001039 [Naegleria lovaniensis]
MLAQRAAFLCKSHQFFATKLFLNFSCSILSNLNPSTRSFSQSLFFKSKHQLEHVQIPNNIILDERPISISERSFLTPSMKEYGNGLVLRIVRFSIVESLDEISQSSSSSWKKIFHQVLKEALTRIQKTQPLLQSRIIRDENTSTGFKFVMIDDEHVPEIPFYEIQFDHGKYSSLQDYLERSLLQRSYDLEKNFQLEVYYHVDSVKSELSLMFCYNHCIGDGLSLSNFIGSVLNECENIYIQNNSNQMNSRGEGVHSHPRKLLPSSDQVILQSPFNSFTSKMKALLYGIPWIFKTITTRINQTLVDESKRFEKRQMCTTVLELDGTRTKALKKFSKTHALSQNSLILSLLSHAYIRVACSHYIENHQRISQSHQSQFNSTLRIGYPVGLSLIPDLNSVLDGSKLTVHVGTMMRDVTISPLVSCMTIPNMNDDQRADTQRQEQTLQSSIIEIARDIKDNHTKHFTNQFTLVYVMTSAANREKAILKSIETNDIHFGGIPLNFILTNNGHLESVMKRCYQFSDSLSLMMESMYAVANTSALASALACGVLTLPADNAHNKEAQLIVSISSVQPVVTREKLLAIQDELENLIGMIAQ